MRVAANRVRALALLAALSLLSGVWARGAYPSGTVVGWGDNAFHQTNVPANVTNVVALAGGFYHGLALRADGTVAAWGDGTYGQTNVPVGLVEAQAIAAGLYHSLALQNGSVIAWGRNNSGQARPR